MKLKKQTPKGFTVIELMVVIIIIAIVASIGTNTYRAQREVVRYNDSIVTVIAMIKKARNYAVTSRPVFDTCQIEGEESYIPEAGYGVYIERSDNLEESRLVLFANTIADDELEAHQYDYDQGSPCTSDLIEEEYNLPLITEFPAFLTDREPAPDGTPLIDDTVVILFTPPLADAYVAVNDPLYNDLDEVDVLDDLYMEFRRQATPAGIPSTYVHMNRVAGFPEIESQ